MGVSPSYFYISIQNERIVTVSPNILQHCPFVINTASQTPVLVIVPVYITFYFSSSESLTQWLHKSHALQSNAAISKANEVRTVLHFEFSTFLPRARVLGSFRVSGFSGS